MVNILFFALEFAPNNTTGAHRSIKFAKNLRRFGINPIVITTNARDSLQCFGAPIDDGLMNGLEDIEIVRYPIRTDSAKFRRSKVLRFMRQFFRIDEGLSTRWPVDIDYLMDTYRPAAVFITLPPFSLWRIVLEIKKSYSVPVITDMRDAWALWAPGGYFSKIHFNITLAKEKKLFTVSDSVLGVTPQLLELFKMSHPEVASNKFSVVFNFLDSSFRQPAAGERNSTKQEKAITIGYIGSFYYMPRTKNKITDIFRYYPLADNWLYRSPYFFLKTLSLMFSMFPQLKHIVFFECAGKIPNWLPAMIASFDLQENVVLHGFLNGKNLEKFQDRCEFFLATAEKIAGMEHFCLPSKLFEYVRVGKPILGFVTNGIQREFLNQSGISFTFDPDLFEENAKRLAEIIFNRAVNAFEINEEYLTAFSEENQTRRLASIVHSVITGVQ